MRQLTFSGFVERYVISLSLDNATAVHKLVREAEFQNPRLREPLFLYALSTGRLKTLLTASRSTCLYEEYSRLAEMYTFDSMVDAFVSKPDVLPGGYLKVWRSYQSVSKEHERDVRVKRLIRTRVVSMQENKKVSTYKLCKELRLNNSNVNAWLKHDAPNKVGLETARRILQYMENQE